MKYFLLAFFIFLGFCALFGVEDSILQDFEANKSPIDVKSAWERVLQNNDALKAQEQGVKRAEKLAFGARLSYLPEINFQGIYVHLNEVLQYTPNFSSAQFNIPQLDSLLRNLAKPITLLERNVMIGAFNIVYPLYTGGLRRSTIALADIAKKDANEAMRIKKLATFEEFVSIYYADVLARDILAVCVQNFETSKLHYQNALALEKSGQIAHLEVLASQVASDKFKNNLRSANNALQSANLALQSALDSLDFIPSSKIEISTQALHDESYYVQKALASYPALRILEHKIQSVGVSKNIASAAFTPQIVGIGSYLVTDKQDSLIIANMPSWYVGVGVNFSFITPRARIQQYQVAKITELELISLREQAIKDLTLLVRRTYKEAVSAREEYNTLSSSVLLAQENLKLQTRAFKQGMATSAQVIDAQNALESVLIQQKSVGFKAIIALSKLLALSDEIDLFYKFQN